MAKRRIYVVDDEEPIRRSTRLMLMVQGYDVETFESGAALVDICVTLAPGSLLLDIRMPGMDGLEVQRSLQARGCDVPVIVMTGHGDLGVAVAALQAGAIAFLEKPFSRRALDSALRTAFLKLEAPEAFEAQQAEARNAVESLGATERELLRALTLGLSNEAIASLLGVSPQAVDARRARLFAELGVETIPDALTLAFAAGLGPETAEQSGA